MADGYQSLIPLNAVPKTEKETWEIKGVLLDKQKATRANVNIRKAKFWTFETMRPALRKSHLTAEFRITVRVVAQPIVCVNQAQAQ